MSSPTYVSSSGTLTAQPLSSRLVGWLSTQAEVAYYFFDTLLSPITNPASWTDPSYRPSANVRDRGPHDASNGRGTGGGNGGGNGGGGFPRGGNSGGGGGFMSMSDLRGGATVDSCRATCG